MELNEIKSIWQSLDARIEKSAKLNERCLELIQAQKVRSKLTPIFLGRTVELIAHSIVLLLLIAFLINNIGDIPYAASAGVLMIFYTLAITHCIQQINIIRTVDYSCDVVTIQSSLARLQTNMVNYARMSVLCIPTFLAFPMVLSKAIKDLHLTALIDFDIMLHSNGNWWQAQWVSTVILIPLCIWFYNEVTYKNIHKPWVRKFIEKAAGTRVRKATEFLSELENLRR